MSRKAINLHIGIFGLMFSLAYLLVRYGGASTELLRAVPPLFLLYLSVFYIFRSTIKQKKKKNRASEINDKNKQDI